MYSVGLDIGFGDTKVVVERVTRLKFASMWSPYSGSTLGMGSLDDILVSGGRSFTYGDDVFGRDARTLSNGINLSSDGTLPLLLGALWETGIGSSGNPKEVIIGTGMPVSQYDQGSDEMRESLEGHEFQITSMSGEERRIVVRKAVIIPQGAAAALYLLSGDSFIQRDGLAVIIDIGFKTTNIFTMNLHNMRAVPELCFTLFKGVGDVASRLNRIVAGKTGYIMPEDLARQTIARKVSFRGQTFGGEKETQPLFDDLEASIRDSVLRYFGGEMSRVTTIIPVGGGANFIGKKIKSIVPGSYVSASEEDRPFTNSLGYKIAADTELRNLISTY